MTEKILIISSWAPPRIGGPQNLYTILSTLPPDSYSILTSYYGIDNYSAKNGSWLTGRYYFYDNPGFSDTQENRENINIETVGREKISSLKYRVKRIPFLRIILGPLLIFGQVLMMIRSGLTIIKNNDFNAILGVSDFGPALISSYIIHKITGKKLSLYLFDIYRGNALLFPGNILAALFEPMLFRDADKIIVTNGGTKDLYVKRYGKSIREKMYVIYNSIFPDSYIKEKGEGPYKTPATPYKIVFTGGIYWPQARSIKNLISVIKSMDLDVQLDIYSTSPKDYLTKIGIRESNKVKIESAPPERMPEIQGSADILFLPLSWHTKGQQIIDTATPGKLTDYLIAGKPILIHAPASSFLVKYARDNDFAAVVDQEDIEQLKEAITKLLTDTPWRKKLVENAKNTFFKNHDANRNTLLFQDIIKNY